MSRVGAVSVALCLAFALVGCGGSSDSTGDQQTTKLDVTLDFAIDGLHAPLFVAKDKGYYTDKDLSVAIHPSGGSQIAITQVATGKAQFGVADAATAVAAQAGGADIMVVAVLLQNTPASTVTRKDANITDPKQLVGKTMGLNAGSSQTKLLPAFFAKNGIDGKKVRQVTIDKSAIIATMLAGKIDASNQFAQTSAKILDQVNIIPWYKYGIDSYGSTLIANKKYLAENPEAARAFVQATMKGLKYTVSNAQGTADILASASQGDVTFFKSELEILRPFMTNANVEAAGYGTMEESRWKTTQDLNMQYLGQTKELPMDQIYTSKYLSGGSGK